MDIHGAGELLTIAATVLGCTWYLSSKIEEISGVAKSTRDALRRHEAEDEREFSKLERRIETARAEVMFAQVQHLQPPHS